MPAAVALEIEALRMELALAEKGIPTPAPEGSLRYAARALLIRAAVDTAAFREVGDRLDGKPAQTTDVNIRHVKASQIGDDELADIALGRGEGIAEAAVDPAVTH